MDLYEIVKNRDFSIYGESTFIGGLIEYYDIHLSDKGYSMEILDDENYVILSRCGCGDEGEVCIIEEMFNEYGHQIYNESDIVIIQEDIINIVDVDEIVAEEIITISKDDEEDEFPEIIEEILDEALEELEDERNCPHCVIKEALLEAFDMGRKYGLIDAMDKIEELL